MTVWLKQTKDQPLFPDILWSRPENKQTAGKLLIVGGNLHAFSNVANAYSLSLDAGAGTVRVIVPSSLYKSLGKIFPEAMFAPSTPSGSFAKQSLAEILDAANWADGLLLAGDFGRNSETAVLLESLVGKTSRLLCLAGDSIDYFLSAPDLVIKRSSTVLVAEFGQLQKLLHGKAVLKHDMDLAKLVEVLAESTTEAPVTMVTQHFGNIIIAHGEQVSTTKIDSDLNKLSARIAVFALQNPTQIFEALSTSLITK